MKNLSFFENEFVKPFRTQRIHRWKLCFCLLLLKAVVLNECPLIVAGGDAFVAKYATVDDCIASSYEISKIVQNSL